MPRAGCSHGHPANRGDWTPGLDYFHPLLPPKNGAWADVEGWGSGGLAHLMSGPGVTIYQLSGLGQVT